MISTRLMLKIATLDRAPASSYLRRATTATMPFSWSVRHNEQFGRPLLFLMN